MNKLEKLQKALRALIKRLEEIRAMKPEDLTDEIREERDKALVDSEQLAKDVKNEKRFLSLQSLDLGDDAPPEGAVSDPEGRNIEIPDKPIYRGSTASAFGQQLADVAIMTDPNTGSEEKRHASSRLEQSTKRALTLIEKRQGQKPSREFEQKSYEPFNPEYRAAGSGMIQGIGSEGGFLLQSETSIDLITHGFNNNAVLSRCSKRTLTGSESLEVVGIDETSRADGSRGGGIRVYTDAELSQMTSSKTKFEMIKLAPERLTGLFYASDKILKNATFLGQEMGQLFREEFAFKTQDLVMEGTGGGQALGVKNADCTVEISKESGQSAATIVSENILKMFARFYFSGAMPIWVANRNCFVQLYTMTHDVGTGGTLARLFSPPRNAGENGSMLGYPVEFIEQAETLGTAGDIQLCDFSQYLVVDYGDINEASSIHFKFDYGQTTFRFIYYFDGQPRWVSALTPFKGSSDTIGPFVRVETRS